MEDDHRYFVRSRAIIMHEGKLLVVSHPHRPENYVLPGGHFETGEGPFECATRELKEELGVAPELGRLLYVSTFVGDEGKRSIDFFIEVKNGAEYSTQRGFPGVASGELADVRWVAPGEEVRILPREIAQDLARGALLSDTVRTIFGTK